MWIKPGDDGEPKNAVRESVTERREALYASCRRVYWPLVAFLTISLWANSGFRFLPPIPAEWNQILGAPPPPALINALFVLYLLSALIIHLMRMAREDPPDPGFRPVAYLTAFYAFHHIAGSLKDNFIIILIGGSALLTLQCYRDLQHYRRELQEL